MKAWLYIRASRVSFKDMHVEKCEQFCAEEGLDIAGIYFDIGVLPSSPKTRWKGFAEMFKNIREEDCIVCPYLTALPPFFLSSRPVVPIGMPGEIEILDKLNSHLKTSYNLNDFIAKVYFDD